MCCVKCKLALRFINEWSNIDHVEGTLEGFNFIPYLSGFVAQLGGDSRWNNTRRIESTGWEESRSRTFSQINL